MSVTNQTSQRIDVQRMGQDTVMNVRLNLGTYATGGVDYNPALYAGGPQNIVIVDLPNVGGYGFEWVPATKLILARVLSTGAEVANGTDLSALDVRASFTLNVA